jgi:hypothetical protein
VRAENVDTDDTVVEGRVSALDDLVVHVLLVVQGVKALENEIEESSQVLRRWTCDEDVRVAVENSEIR